MNKRALEGFIKHGDFILLDMLCLQLAFVLGFWIREGVMVDAPLVNPYEIERYRIQALMLTASQLLVVLFFDNYHGILRRKRFDEFVAVCLYLLEIVVITIIYMFLMHRTSLASRLALGFASLIYVVMDFVLRQANKRRLNGHGSLRTSKRSLVLVTSSALAADAVRRLQSGGTFKDFFVSSVVLMDVTDGSPDDLDGVPVRPLSWDTVESITHGWVDEVFILQPDDLPFPTRFMDDLTKMGLTVSFSLWGMGSRGITVSDTGKIGPYQVLTSSIRDAPLGQIAIKRLFDIIGGLVGCLITGVLCLVVGPLIYRASPGPIFFSQERVGRNGKTFRMYKFRSMYLDAEERKAALAKRNLVDDGLMFKVSDDPRVIGSERRGKDGRPRGIGTFIRRTSIDEFPQFLNVLRGEMSLVGTRPPTMDEWERYNLEHRVRMSIKPGITGLWQVSGRSKITNFDDVVRLDREYIEDWNLALDVKILLKTFVVVLMGRGAL